MVRPGYGEQAAGSDMHTILLIDDDEELCPLLDQFLTGEGFRVDTALDCASGMEALLTGNHDIVILDVMLPDCSGLELLRRLRDQSDIPVLMLTAKGDDIDRVLGLEMGADDYMPKPFLPRELVARLRAVLRRAVKGNDAPRRTQQRIIRVDDLEIDTGARRVLRQGRSVSLTATEYELARVLVSQAGAVVTRERLTMEAMGRDPGPLDRSLDVHISNLRRKLGTSAQGDQRIKTVRGTGYMYAVSTLQH